MADTKPDPKAVLEFVKENNVQMLDLRFTDLPGLWHHVSYPIHRSANRRSKKALAWMARRFAAGRRFMRATCCSFPMPSRYMLDPFTEVPTLVMVCDVIDPVTKQRYDRDPRYIAKKAEMYLASTGLADTAFFGAEAEFFIFDNVRFDQNEHEGYLLHRRRRRPLEFRPRGKQSRLSSALQGRLFPGPADRSLPGPAHRDDA